ncbi:hypothetical protein [Brevundimonas pishanensis]|uniref:hypothetical protein n=1 Tax=Brevundimonas pishanensis TaxID=2896315 RepID=UPI001FA6C479|nr:hypothetical protein [Brevundimonas pishanensis]
MNRRFVSPFASLESRQQAESMQACSVTGFVLWAVTLGVLATAILAGMGSEPEASRGAAAGLCIFMAVVAAAAGWVQWRKPNRILPSFGVAWSLYELSSLMVGLMVGAPMAAGGLSSAFAWGTAAVLVVCAALHVGALRATFYLARAQ